MKRNDFLNEILPASANTNAIVGGKGSMRIYQNKNKDVNFIKKIAREKLELQGAPIAYFKIDLDSATNADILKDATDLKLLPPVLFTATWTPQEYQMNLSKFGFSMPFGQEQQLFLHVDMIDDFIKRKPLVGDVIETLTDRTRYRITDVFFGHGNLWENIFCMVTLTKVTRNNYTEQLDAYDAEYANTYTKLEETLGLMGEETHQTNLDIQTERKKTTKKTVVKKTPTETVIAEDAKDSIDTGYEDMTRELPSTSPGLDIMTMKL